MTRTLIALALVAGALLGAAPAHAEPADATYCPLDHTWSASWHWCHDYPEPASIAARVGDDNAEGVIDEDESGWDCATMGNRICGPVA